MPTKTPEVIPSLTQETKPPLVEFYLTRLRGSQAHLLYSLLPEQITSLVKWFILDYTSKIIYGRGDMPLTVAVETFSACNYHCSYCPIDQEIFKQSRAAVAMSDELFGKIVGELATLPNTRTGQTGFRGPFFLTGYGEPLLDKNLPAKVALVRKQLPQARVGFFSNGSLLSTKTYQELKEAGIQQIIITLHGDRFPDATKEVLATFGDQKIIKINPPLTRFNNRGGMIPVTQNQLAAPVYRCVSPTYGLVVASDGNIALCCNDASLQQPQGNLGTSNLLDIWFAPDYVKLRNALRHGHWQELPKLCTLCRTPTDYSFSG